MKKLTFWKSLFLLCALIVGSSSAWADDDITITWNINGVKTEQTASAGGKVDTDLKTSSITPSGASGTWTAVSNGNSSYAATNSDKIAQLGAKNSRQFTGTITLSNSSIPSSATIKNITFTAKSNGSSTLSATVGGSSFGSSKTINNSTLSDYSIDGTGSGNEIILTLANTTASKYIAISKITVTYSNDSRAATTTAITVPEGFKTDLENGTNVAAGQLSAAVTYGSPATAIPSAPITWTSTNTDAATVDGSGNVTLKAVGTTTIKAQYEGTTTEYQPSEASYVLNVVDTYAKGQLHNPFTVAEALEFIAALGTGNKTGDDEYYTHGIVSYVDDEISSGKLNYGITADGVDDEDNCLNVYESKYLGNADFTTSNKLKVGDEVTVKGQLENYGSKNTPYSNNGYLISLQTKTTPTFTISPDEAQELDAYSHETVDITLTTNTDGDVTCESSNADVATVTLKSAGVYTITAQTKGTANITIKSAMSATYYSASKTIEVTVTDDREDSGIAFAESSFTKTWGQSFTGQALTNEHSVPVTYSSTDETVATVNSEGTVTILKAGETTIKATFDGNETYFATVVSYTLTINKANAGLSFSPNSFEIDLNESFTAPTLNNPNNLAVTYGSNNTEVATVDENTGELTTLVTSAVGTATITASFEGNDNYDSGIASYTIKVIDSYAKGGKNNPYSVAEVEALTEDKTGVYVTGYIVGCVNSSNSKAYKTTTSEWNNANLLLSDDRDISFTEGTSIGKKTADNLIPVQLPTNDLKNTWGISITSGAVIGYKILLKGNGLDYFTGKGVKSTSEINAVTAPVTITAAEYATYNNANYALDFSETGITVYTAQDKETSVGLTEVTTGQIPASTPVVLHKAVTSSTTINVPVIASADAIEGTNDLRVKDSGDDVENMYVLAKPSGKNVGFYPWTGTKLNAGKIYLQGKGSYGAREFLGFDGTATGIANVDINANDNFDANAPMYNLAGQRVNKSYKGVVIVNGKKYMNK